MTEWYDDGPDDGTWWWAVEHHGHPAFFMRALMPGDFAPGRLPLPRHLMSLDLVKGGDVRCGTCEEVPASADLEPIERRTAGRGFLDDFRARRLKWPPPTDPASCSGCSDRRQRVLNEAGLCPLCAADQARRG